MSKKTIIKTTLVNIDSSNRTIYPKNICHSDCKTLSSNPLSFTKGSNIVNINYQNHNFTSGDNITIQNVEGINKNIINSVYIFNNFKYAMIIFESNNIEIDKTALNNIYCNIDIVGDQIENNLIESLPFNTLIGVKRCLLFNDISSLEINNILDPTFLNTLYSILVPTSTIITDITSNIITQLINKKCIFIELPNEFNSIKYKYIQINQIFKVSYLHIGGIPLGYLNANYPINNYNYQNSYEVYNVLDSNNFSIVINFESYGTLNGGGNNIIITKVLSTLVGYPNADEYVIDLKKSFNNVTNIELVSTEFPYIDMVIKKNINDKLYWKNIEDGSVIYNVIIDEGFYSSDTFLTQLNLKINNVPRYNNTIINKNMNNFDILIESNIQKITFKPYNLSLLPNSLSIREEYIDSDSYYILTVIHPNNFVEVNDIILITNSNDVNVFDNKLTDFKVINSSYINKEHIVYSVNLNKLTYDIILGKKTNISSTIPTTSLSTQVTSNNILTGGENIIVKSKTKVSFLFNYPDTCGDILGFKNVGNNSSILDFNSIITNYDPYMNSINLDSVGNIIDYPSGFMNFVGKFNYFLMYLNDIEYIFNSNNNLKSSFGKIQLCGNPGDILFNTFVPVPSNIYYKEFPISTLIQLNIKFTYPDGSRINFRNINHSFTLKITEENIKNDNTNLNSQNISVIDEYINAKLKD